MTNHSLLQLKKLFALGSHETSMPIRVGAHEKITLEIPRLTYNMHSGHQSTP